MIHRIPARWNPLAATAGGLAAVAALTALLLTVDDHVEVLSLAVCYQLIVLVVSGAAGAVPGLVTALASVLAFNWFFLPPVHTLNVADSRNWISLAVFGATALITGQLAAGARRQREESEARRRDAAAVAQLAGAALADIGPGTDTERVARAAAAALEAEGCRIVLGAEAAEAARRRSLHPDATEGGSTVPLVARGRPIGLLEVGPPRADRNRDRSPGFAAAVGGIVALALERSRLLAQALELETLRRSDELKTTLLRSVSHEFRTPLTAMRAAGEALAHDPPPEDADELVAVLTGEAERLERLVANLLDLSRLEAGELVTRMEWCDPAEMVSGAVGAARPLIGPDEVAVIAPDDLPLVRADAALCERILVNLLHNAARHGAPPVTLEARARGDVLEVTVADMGEGPDPAVAARLFSPFAAGRATGGTGVGLALARGFAEAQGGTLRLEPADAGTRFKLALPLEPVPEVV